MLHVGGPPPHCGAAVGAMKESLMTDVLRLDEDALPGALLGGLDHGVQQPVGDLGHAVSTLGVPLSRGEDFAAFLHVGQTVVQQREHVGADLFAQPVTGAEILIDPDLHPGGLPRAVKRFSAIYTGVAVKTMTAGEHRSVGATV